MSPIRFECAECGRKISAPDEAAGTEGSCPQCGEVLEIPEESTRKASKGSETRQIKAPGTRRRRRGGGGRGRGGGEPGMRKEPQMQAWHIVLLVGGVVIGLGSLVFALTRSSPPEPEQVAVRKKVVTEEAQDEPEKAKKPGDGDSSAGKQAAAKKTPRKKKPRKSPKNPVKEIPYTAQVDNSKTIEAALVSGDQRSVLKKIDALPAKIALPILLNAIRQLDLSSEDGGGRGTFIDSLLREKSELNEKAPQYDPTPRGASTRDKCRKEWFDWYWQNKDSL